MGATTTRPPRTAEEQAARVFAWRRGFNACWLVDLGIKLGLFKDLAANPGSTVEAIAGRLALQVRHVEVWCRTAFALEILDVDANEAYRLAPGMDLVLASPSHPRYVGGYVQLGTDYATEDFRALREAFKSGESAPFQGRDERFSHHVAEATFGLQFLSARKLLPEIEFVKARLDAGGALLEVGPGSARQLLLLAACRTWGVDSENRPQPGQLVPDLQAHSPAMGQKDGAEWTAAVGSQPTLPKSDRLLDKGFPAARLVGVDIDPTGVRLAREVVATAGLADRITIVEGTIEDAAALGPFAAVVMVEVLHEIRQDLRGEVVKACGRALVPGGWLVVVDETYPESVADFRAPDFQFAVQTGFEELHWGNVVPTRGEQEALFTAAGFSPPLREVMGAGFTILKAERPAG